MGIKNLGAVLRKHCPHVYEDTHISTFAGKRIGIDIIGYMYRYVAANPSRWLNSFVTLFCALKRNQIRPLIVYEGTPPPEKARTRERRNATTQKIRDRAEEVDKLVEQITKYSEAVFQNQTDVTIENFDEVKSKCEVILKKLYKDELAVISEPEDLLLYLDDLIKERDRLAKSCVYITRDHDQKLRRLVEILGIPYVDAPGEAETLCAYLSKHNYITGVITEDTDILAYGTANFISKFTARTERCVLLQYEKVLDGLEMDEQQFTDFCIMCGTDYNDNIPRCGAIGAYKKMIEYGDLDMLVEKSKMDTTILNYKVSRRLFSVPKVFAFEMPRFVPPDFTELEIFLAESDCSITMAYIKKAWAPVPLNFVD